MGVASGPGFHFKSSFRFTAFRAFRSIPNAHVQYPREGYEGFSSFACLGKKPERSTANIQWIFERDGAKAIARPVGAHPNKV